MLVVDAGGTIDISSYVVTNNAPLQVEELFGPECWLIRPWFLVRSLSYPLKA